jgi:hypothetical protein
MIDPSSALGSKRYGLPPTEQELQTYDKLKQVIAQTASNSDVLIITHYHFDHYDPAETLFTGKKVFTKDVDENINITKKSGVLSLKNSLRKHAILYIVIIHTIRLAGQKSGSPRLSSMDL